LSYKRGEIMPKYLIEEQVIKNYEVEADDEYQAKDLWVAGALNLTDTVHIDVEVKEIE
tara:strand:+ start:8865 stop:9038 length:174 start_codon:yes stop_codon:yes gene_type:complete